MKKPVSIITIFVLLNLLVGRLFQESLGVVCFTELGIVALSGFVFWRAISGKIAVFANRWNGGFSTKQLCIQGGMGLSLATANILIGQMLLIFLMTTIYNCTSPSFGFINASLTNNIAVNLFCYFALLFFFVNHQKENNGTREAGNMKESTGKVEVSKGSSKLLLDPTEISHVEASNNCVVLHTAQGKFIKYQSLKSLEDELKPYNFKRVHRSFLVNAHTIRMIRRNKNGDGTLTLKCGASVKFSRTYQNHIS